MGPLKEIVITGLGIVSPIGVGVDSFWKGLLSGRSGVTPLTFPGAEEMPVKFGAQVTGFDAKEYVTPRKSLKVMCQEIQFGYASAVMAMQQAGLAPDSFDHDRCGVVMGADMYYCPIDDMEGVYRHCRTEKGFEYNVWGEKGMSDLYPLWMLKYLPNMTACHLAIANDARGPNNTIALGDSSALLALMEGAQVIQRGLADVMICGASGCRLSLTPWMYRGALNQSHRNEDPSGASRPFDAGRDGMVNGEGAAAYIIESREYAEARGARILARVLGWSSTFAPDVESEASRTDSIARSIRQTLERSEVDASAVGHVNAHGLSTVDQDRCEAQAIRQCLGDAPVTAMKSIFGSLGAAGGAAELVGSVMAMLNDQVPATINYETPDPQCPVNVVHGAPLKGRPKTALLLNQSGTGQAAAVLIAGD